MPRLMNCLTDRTINAFKRRGHYSDGGGLYLSVAEGGSKQWVFRFKEDGKARDMGLGPLHTVSLAEAREKALEQRKLRLEGIDPIEYRTRQRQAVALAKAKAVTFKDVAEAYLDLHLESFKNAKHRYQWRATLETYVYPKVGPMTVADIGPADVLRCVEPIWNTKRETASRVRQRIERILDYATTRQYRSGDNPAAHVTEFFAQGRGRQESSRSPGLVRLARLHGGAACSRIRFQRGRLRLPF